MGGEFAALWRFMRKSKFNVEKDIAKRTYDGIVFDSVMEMKYYRDVVCPKKESGDIVCCELQKPYELQPSFTHDGFKVQPIKYVADFFIVYKDGREEVIDTKGYADTTAIIKRKMFWYHYPDVEYKWITYSAMDGGWTDYEVVKKRRAATRLEKKHKEEKEQKYDAD